MLLVPLTPSLEVSTQLLLCYAKPLQLSLHQAACFEQSFPLIQFSRLGQGYVEANSAAVARHLNRRHRLKVRSQLGPQLTNADTDGHCLDHTSVYTLGLVQPIRLERAKHPFTNQRLHQATDTA